MSDEAPRTFEHDDEMVDEAGRESFPASDPPAYSSGVADAPSRERIEKTAAEDRGDASGGDACKPGKSDNKQDDKRGR